MTEEQIHTEEKNGMEIWDALGITESRVKELEVAVKAEFEEKHLLPSDIVETLVKLLAPRMQMNTIEIAFVAFMMGIQYVLPNLEQTVSALPTEGDDLCK